MAVHVEVSWIYPYEGWGIMIWDDSNDQHSKLLLIHKETEPDALNLTIDAANLIRDSYGLARYTGKDFGYNLADWDS